VKEPFRVVNFELGLSSSIGICTYPRDGGDISKLIQSADLAMCEAKKAGKDRIAVYDREMARQAARRLYLENALPKALENGEIMVYYQPQVDVPSGTICGVEALARWKHPYLEMISPLEFIQYAEDRGFIIELGEWILTQACLEVEKWGKVGFDDIVLSVNVSLRQMNQLNFVKRIKDILYTVGFAPSRLELEITESVFMDNPELTRTVVRELEKIGVRLAIDDFGTGYSSLESLHRLSFHTLKLDRGFVQNMEDERDQVVVKAIIDLAHNLGLSVVAEGVETVQQLKILESHGCSVVQGYLFGQPMSGDAFLEFLREIEETGVKHFA
jgi:EAL domain-containing protein (putative c-di-GMP-specific phosphodiesterase class I)